MILTYRYRIKESSAKRHLNRHAVACNQVWNFCVATQREAQRRYKAGGNSRWPTWVDLGNLCAGSSVLLGIHSDTVSAICRLFTVARETQGRCPKFRASFGPKRSLGWIPFRSRTISLGGDAVRYLRRNYRLWLSRPIDGELCSGAFSQDARGRWYFNIAVDAPTPDSVTGGAVGIDLGLKTLATCSDGTIVPALQNYRRHEAALGKAQRARNKQRVKAIHAKIANCRRHQHHEASTRLVRSNRRIVVGNVSASKLAKTKMAKSVLDAGWSSFRNMLRYKAMRHGVEYAEVSEAYSTQVCSDCGSVSGPKGIAHLRIRHWDCPDCGTSHDRDVNAARNILRAGAECRPPVVEIAA
jgi:putative transposase